jgi:hypothetical protein
MKDELICRIREFLVNEARSRSMDFGCVIPLYAYRMFGGTLAIGEIESALNNLKENNYGYR